MPANTTIGIKIFLLPHLSMNHPANGPSSPPSDLAIANIKLVRIWEIPKESLIAGTNTVKPLKKMPEAKNTMAEQAAITHQP